MEFKAHLTADAVVRQVKTNDGKKSVVSFRAGENTGYKSGDVWIEKSTFYNCSYWLNTDEAERLKKGTAVIIRGRLKLDTYTNGQGVVVPSAEVTVSDISYPAKRQRNGLAATPTRTAEVAEPAGDDLPF